MIYRTNSKIPPLQQHSPSNPFTLSIKSKPRPFLISHSKPLDHPQIQQQSESSQSNQQDQPQVFPVQIYKDMLKGEKIYIQMYYKDKIYQSGYQPYILAMGGQLSKRICPSTTLVLTGLITKQKYLKLKTKVQKICKPFTPILSIIWLEEIYRQKRKVQKQKYLFDQKTDILNDDNHQDEDDDFMPDYFEREVFDIDFNQVVEEHIKQGNHPYPFKIQEGKKFREKLGEQFLDVIEPQKYVLFSQFDEDQFKILKNRKGYKYFYTENNKEKDKKKNRTGNSGGNQNKKLQGDKDKEKGEKGEKDKEKQKKPRRSLNKNEEKKQFRKSELLSRDHRAKDLKDDSFQDSTFEIDAKKVSVRRTIDKGEVQKYKQTRLTFGKKEKQVDEENIVRVSKRNSKERQEIENYQQQQNVTYLPAGHSEGKRTKQMEGNREANSKRGMNNSENSKERDIKLLQIGGLRPEQPNKKGENSKNNSKDSKGKESDGQFLLRARKMKEDSLAEEQWSKMISKSRIMGQQQQQKGLQHQQKGHHKHQQQKGYQQKAQTQNYAIANSMQFNQSYSLSQPSSSTPPRSQSETTQKTITAPKQGLKYK